MQTTLVAGQSCFGTVPEEFPVNLDIFWFHCIPDAIPSLPSFSIIVVVWVVISRGVSIFQNKPLTKTSRSI
jgi:hypothetical protein